MTVEDATKRDLGRKVEDEVLEDGGRRSGRHRTATDAYGPRGTTDPLTTTSHSLRHLLTLSMSYAVGCPQYIVNGLVYHYFTSPIRRRSIHTDDVQVFRSFFTYASGNPPADHGQHQRRTATTFSALFSSPTWLF